MSARHVEEIRHRGRIGPLRQHPYGYPGLHSRVNHV